MISSPSRRSLDHTDLPVQSLGQDHLVKSNHQEEGYGLPQASAYVFIYLLVLFNTTKRKKLWTFNFSYTISSLSTIIVVLIFGGIHGILLHILHAHGLLHVL